MFRFPFSSRTVAAVSCAVVVIAASGIHGESYLRSSTHAATAPQQQPRDLQFTSLLPAGVLAIIPAFCQDGDDSALNEAITCATGSLMKCAGLLGVLDQFEDLIPSNADDVTSCQDISDPFCEIATNCEPCLAQFEALTRCIVEKTDEGVIDAAIINLVAGCSLACDGSSEGEATLIEIVDVEEDIPVTVVVSVDEESEDDEAPEPEALDDIPGTAMGAGIFTTLVAALDAAGLVETLSEPKGPYTVFAPTDTAFDNLPEGLVPCLLQDLPTLTNILLYHVADGAVLAAKLSDDQTIPTLLPQQAVTVDISSRAGPQGSTAPRVQINGSTVTTADVMTSNGVIHIIDAVLVPSNIDIEAYLQTCTEEDAGDYTYDNTDTNNGLPDGDFIGDIFGDIFSPGNGGGSDGNGDGSSGDLGGFDDIDVESIGTAIGNAVGSFLGEDVGVMIGNAFNSFVSSLGDIFANSGDGSSWLGGMSGGGDNGGSGIPNAGGWFGDLRKRN